MTNHVAHIDLAAAFAPPRRCPVCQIDTLQACGGSDRAVFRCAVCGLAWSVSFGQYEPVPDELDPSCGSG